MWARNQTEKYVCAKVIKTCDIAECFSKILASLTGNMYLCNMRRLLFVLVLCIAQMAVAQPAAKTAFKTLGMSDGLRSNSVTSLLADSRGYLWIGTTQGLNRYDGYEVKSRFPESNNQHLSELFSKSVSSMQEDADGRIWIQCGSGSYYIYDTRTAHFSANATQLLHSIGIACGDNYKIIVYTKIIVHSKTFLFYPFYL